VPRNRNRDGGGRDTDLGVTAFQGASFNELLTDTVRLTAEGLRAEFCKVLEHGPGKRVKVT
jgi:hypothetical protein